MNPKERTIDYMIDGLKHTPPQLNSIKKKSALNRAYNEYKELENKNTNIKELIDKHTYVLMPQDEYIECLKRLLFLSNYTFGLDHDFGVYCKKNIYVDMQSGIIEGINSDYEVKCEDILLNLVSVHVRFQWNIYIDTNELTKNEDNFMMSISADNNFQKGIDFGTSYLEDFYKNSKFYNNNLKKNKT